jgi:hypothetical protein
MKTTNHCKNKSKKTIEDGKILDCKNQYCKNGCITKSNLHVQDNPHQIPMTFITDNEKSTLKFIWKHKRPQITMAILNKKSNAGDFTIPDFKI